MTAIGLIPARLWEMIKYIFDKKIKNKIKILIVFFLIACISIHIEINTLKSIFNCIMHFECGPNRGNRLIHLALLGIVYIIIELLFFIIKIFHGINTKKSSDKFRDG